MKLKESFDNCMAMLGFLAVAAFFFSWGGYVCHELLFHNTIGVLGYLIGGVLLVILSLIAWGILGALWRLSRDTWEARKNHKENDDSTPPEETRRPVDPYEAAVLPQPEPEVDGGENAPERLVDNRTHPGIPLKYSVLLYIIFLPAAVLIWYGSMRADKEKEETEAAVLCSEGMTAYIAKDYDAAVAKFRKAAGKGSARAKYMLGVCCYDGTGEDEDWDAAFRWFYEAGKQDDPDALYRLGLCCEQAVGTERDMEKALFCWGKAAKLGHAEAQRRAGETAISVFGEFDAGVELLRKSAEQGNPFAMRFLGLVFEEKDKAESDDWYRKAAEALYQAAKQGDPRAQHDLAGLYRDGIGVAKDPAAADKWFVLAAKNYCAAAERGDPEAQCQLGGFYMKGVGVEKDEAEAVKWFQKAAEQGFMKGKALLGLAYFEGRGMKKDEVEGVRWLRAAAEQGDPDAQLFLESHGE